MLILTRKVGEKIVFGNGAIQLDVLDFDRYSDIVRLGFTASEDLAIERAERRAKQILNNTTEEQACLKNHHY